MLATIMFRAALVIGCSLFVLPVAAVSAAAEQPERESLRSAIELVRSGACPESDWSYPDPEAASAVLSGELPILEIERDDSEGPEEVSFLFPGPDRDSLYSLEVVTEDGRCIHYSIGRIVRN